MPKSKQSKTNDLHFSQKTGTKKRMKRCKKISKKQMAIQNKEEIVDKRIDLMEGHKSHYIKFLHKEIVKDCNDEVIMELNEESLKEQRSNIFLLAKILNRLDIPTDLNRIILSYAQSNVYIESCIFTLLPDDVVEIFSLERISIHRKLRIFKKYRENYNFKNYIAKILSYIEMYYIIDYPDGLYFTHNINNINNINNNINNNIINFINTIINVD